MFLTRESLKELGPYPNIDKFILGIATGSPPPVGIITSTSGKGAWMQVSKVITLAPSLWGLTSISDVFVPISIILTPNSSSCKWVLGEETTMSS